MMANRGMNDKMNPFDPNMKFQPGVLMARLRSNVKRKDKMISPPVVAFRFVRKAFIVLTLPFLNSPLCAQREPQKMSDHMLERAQAGHLPDELKVARAFRFGFGVDRDLNAAARWFYKAANQGDPTAQHELGLLYLDGTGVPHDDREAFKWFQRAAVENYPPAQFDLADLFLEGRGIPQDLQEGVRWMLRAAQQGYPPAEVNLGIFYLRGFALTADEAKALGWLHKAAKRHFAPAEFVLGTIYEYQASRQTDKRLVEAIYWYRRAAERGYAPAQNNLGNLLDKGTEVPRDVHEAIKWYKLAAEQGDGAACVNLAYLHADTSSPNFDLALAYFWAFVALHNPPVLSEPLSSEFANGLRKRLSGEQIAGIEAKGEKWIEEHHIGTRPQHWLFVDIPSLRAVGRPIH
jgi:TPR repeat protein